jgi:hypothetical protein
MTLSTLDQIELGGTPQSTSCLNRKYIEDLSTMSLSVRVSHVSILAVSADLWLISGCPCIPRFVKRHSVLR